MMKLTCAERLVLIKGPFRLTVSFYPLHGRFNDDCSANSALFSFPVSMEHFVLLRMITPADLFYVSSRRLFVYAGLRYGHLCPMASLFRLL